MLHFHLHRSISLEIPVFYPVLNWGCSSVGRALEWHSRGRRFDPDQLHQFPCPDGHNHLADDSPLLGPCPLWTPLFQTHRLLYLSPAHLYMAPSRIPHLSEQGLSATVPD